mgnify:CR=1 FL=1
MVSAHRPWSPLLDAWFGDALAGPDAAGARMGWWFGPDQRRDAELRERFGPLAEDCAAGRCNEWSDDPEGRLALIVALDQLPRNLYRGSARAFACDPWSAALCMAVLLAVLLAGAPARAASMDASAGADNGGMTANYRDLGRELYADKDYDGAITEFAKVLNTVPDDPEATRYMSFALAKALGVSEVSLLRGRR